MIRLLILCFCSLPLSSLAQYSLELQVGPSLLSVWDQHPTYADYTHAASPGIVFGVTGSYQLTEWLSVQSGLLFQQRGNRGEITLVDPQGNALGTAMQDFYANVYTLPGIIRVHWGRRVRFRLQSGLYLEFTNNGRRVLDNEVSEDWEGDFVFFDLGVGAATGLDWQFYGPLRLGFLAKVDLGMSRHVETDFSWPGYRYVTFSPVIELSYVLPQKMN